MRMGLPCQIEEVRDGKVTQVAVPILVSQADLASGGVVEVKLPQACTALVLIPWVAVGGALYSNGGSILGVQIGSESAPMLVWSVNDGGLFSFEGAIEKFYVTLLANDPANMYFTGLTDVSIGFATGSGSPAVTGRRI